MDNQLLPHANRIGDNLHTRPLAQTHRHPTEHYPFISTSESTAEPEPIINYQFSIINSSKAKVLGQLVVLGFDVAVFTPAPYQRRSLRRPSGSPNLAAGFALRCFQRLSNPDADTRRCTWRYNRQTGGLSNTVLSY